MSIEISDEPISRQNCLMFDANNMFQGGETMGVQVSYVSQLEDVYFEPGDFVRIKDCDRLVKDYSLKEIIGDGTYGHVYRGVHRQTGIVRAIKKIKLQSESQ